jgi:hypothetical protein
MQIHTEPTINILFWADKTKSVPLESSPIESLTVIFINYLSQIEEFPS